MRDDQKRALLDDGGKGEAVATLHDDGYWTWKKGATPPHESNYAGWRMDVYAAPQAECAPREAQPVVEAMQAYLRQCRAGGMPKDVSDQIERAVNQANHLGYFAAPTPERAQEPDPLEQFAKPERSAADDYVPRVSLGERAQESYWQKAAETLERANVELSCAYVELKKKLRAQESAGVRLTPEQSGAIQIAISILTPEYLLTANRLRSIVATIDAELAKK
jgi:hypothetical protein